MSASPRRSPFFAPFRILRAHPQLVLSAAIGLGALMILPPALRHSTRLLIGWNIGLIAYFILVASLISQATHQAIRRRAQLLDEGRGMILMLSVLVATASFGAIIDELATVRDLHGAEKYWGIALTLLTVITSWLFLHLTFALHYAHEYYFANIVAAETHARGIRGLDFPGSSNPNYIDFIYFAYAIGVSFATSDVNVTKTIFRSAVLVHSIIAFFYNSLILALMVNIGSNLI
jgi:uncharacterized membrane protein